MTNTERFSLGSKTFETSDGRTFERFYIRGGRTGQKIHRGMSGSSVLGCGKWVRYNVEHFRLSEDSVNRVSDKHFCERCWPNASKGVDTQKQDRDVVVTPANEIADTTHTGENTMSKKSAQTKAETKSTKKAPAKKATKKQAQDLSSLKPIERAKAIVLANRNLPRKDVVKLMVDAGLNPATARTQYQRFYKDAPVQGS